MPQTQFSFIHATQTLLLESSLYCFVVRLSWLDQQVSFSGSRPAASRKNYQHYGGCEHFHFALVIFTRCIHADSPMIDDISAS